MMWGSLIHQESTVLRPFISGSSSSLRSSLHVPVRPPWPGLLLPLGAFAQPFVPATPPVARPGYQRFRATGPRRTGGSPVRVSLDQRKKPKHCEWSNENPMYLLGLETHVLEEDVSTPRFPTFPKPTLQDAPPPDVAIGSLKLEEKARKCPFVRSTNSVRYTLTRGGHLLGSPRLTGEGGNACFLRSPLSPSARPLRSSQSCGSDRSRARPLRSRPGARYHSCGGSAPAHPSSGSSGGSEDRLRIDGPSNANVAMAAMASASSFYSF